eukprot:GHVP01018701.1.p1 GENE.GHVP01018701.1~~GHVP01018701.1.p1  ORF type:complete len:535 (-),score=81.87 GHVP01018701.1:1207-2811(-)
MVATSAMASNAKQREAADRSTMDIASSISHVQTRSLNTALDFLASYYSLNIEIMTATEPQRFNEVLFPSYCRARWVSSQKAADNFSSCEVLRCLQRKILDPVNSSFSDVDVSLMSISYLTFHSTTPLLNESLENRIFAETKQRNPTRDSNLLRSVILLLSTGLTSCLCVTQEPKLQSTQPTLTPTGLLIKAPVPPVDLENVLSGPNIHRTNMALRLLQDEYQNFYRPTVLRCISREVRRNLSSERKLTRALCRVGLYLTNTEENICVSVYDILSGIDDDEATQEQYTMDETLLVPLIIRLVTLYLRPPLRSCALSLLTTIANCDPHAVDVVLSAASKQQIEVGHVYNNASLDIFARAVLLMSPENTLRHVCSVVDVAVFSLNPSDPARRIASHDTATTALFLLVRHLSFVGFHQESQRLAVGTSEGIIIAYDLRTATRWRVLEGHTGPIAAVCFNPNGKFVGSYSAEDQTFREWQCSSGFFGGLLGSAGKCTQVIKLPALVFRQDEAPKAAELTCDGSWKLKREDGSVQVFQST